jgi:hypothetical protein
LAEPHKGLARQPQKQKPPPLLTGVARAEARNRTADLLITSEPLYHLSYIGDKEPVAMRYELGFMRKKAGRKQGKNARLRKFFDQSSHRALA